MLSTFTQRICVEIRIAALAFLELRPENSFDDIADDATIAIVVKTSPYPEIDIAWVFISVVKELNVLKK